MALNLLHITLYFTLFRLYWDYLVPLQYRWDKIQKVTDQNGSHFGLSLKEVDMPTIFVYFQDDDFIQLLISKMKSLATF